MKMVRKDEVWSGEMWGSGGRAPEASSEGWVSMSGRESEMVSVPQRKGLALLLKLERLQHAARDTALSKTHDLSSRGKSPPHPLPPP